MEPIPETAAAFDELDPVAEDDVRLVTEAAAQQVRDLVPDCIGLSIATTAHGVTFTFVATEAEVAVLDAVQYIAGGPCVEALETGDLIEADADVFAERRWQVFGQTTAARGVQSTLTLPVLDGERVVATVNLYGASPRAFVGLHDHLSDIFGAWAAGAVTNADLAFETRRRAAEAPQHLRLAAKVSTAVGIICARLHVAEDEGRRLLRDAAACAGLSELRVAEALLDSWQDPTGGEPHDE